MTKTKSLLHLDALPMMNTDLATEIICQTCEKPIAMKSGSMTQWIFDTSKCSCGSAHEEKQQRCALCALPIKTKIGSITQWIFKTKSCSCLVSIDSDAVREEAATLPSDELISGAPYEFLGVTGYGGAATVYKARNKKLGRLVAVKILQAPMSDERSRQNFAREAKAASKLQHPNVVTVQDFGEMADGRQYLATEWIEGITLAQYMSRHGRLTVEIAQEVFSQVLDGLSHAHKRGVVHRDIKPNNIMLTRGVSGGWTVKIIDFGTAKEIDNEGSVTRAEDLACSPFYMSPEQATGEGVDNRSDLYSVGCSLFETLTGRPPFTGVALSVVMRHQLEQPPTLMAASGGVEFPDYIEAIVAKLLAKAPSDRFQSDEDVKSALRGSVRYATGSSGRNSRTGAPREVLPVGIIGVSIAAVCGIAYVIDLFRMERAPESKKVHLSSGERSIRKLAAESTASPTQAERRFLESGADYWRDNASKSHALAPDEKLESLPASRVRVVSINFNRRKSLDGLASLTNLKMLKLWNAKLTPALCDQIVEATSISDLQIVDSEIDCDPAVELARMPRLSWLEFNDCGLTAKDLQNIHMLKRLYTLCIPFNSELSDAAFVPIGKFKQLGDLRLEGIMITDKTLHEIRSLTSLTNLSFSSTGVTDAGCSYIANFRELDTISAGASSIGDAGAKLLFTLPKLKFLALRSSKVTDASLPGFEQMKSLKHLDLLQCPGVSDQGIGRLRLKRPDMKVICTGSYDALIHELLPEDQLQRKGN